MSDNSELMLRKQGLFKYWWLLIILFFFFFLYFIVSGAGQLTPQKPPSDFLITHNIFDLDQVVSISRFRSCAGHRSMSQGSKEPDSSMATYFRTNVKEYPGRLPQIKVYAPFDGYITPMIGGFSFVPKSSKFPWWPFNQYRIIIEHVKPLPEYEGTVEVKVGELVGYDDSSEFFPDAPVKSLDIRVGVVAFPPERNSNQIEPFKNMDSVFRYMSDEVFAEYTKIIPELKSREDLIIPVEWRIDHPCTFQDDGPYFEHNIADNSNSRYSDFVTVQGS